MKSRLLICIASISFLLLGAIFTEEASQSQPKEYKLTIKKIGNDWKVVDAQDNAKTQVRAKRGDKISWTAEGSDVYFQFMDQRLFGDYTRMLKKGQTLNLNIGGQAAIGENRYAVFVAGALTFATGDSPPKIIIE